MKRWAYTVAISYVLIVTAVLVPVGSIAFGKWPSLEDWADVLSAWPVWLALFICQFAMLTVPVRITGLRPLTHWSKWPSILASGLMMAGLAVGAWLALCECFRLECFSSLLLLMVVGLTIWLLWSVAFFRRSRKVTPAALISQQCRVLFTSSILGLLIAVPTHIVASHRVGWFAGTGTSLGLAMSIAVMLFSFGPAVFLLYAARWRRLHPAAATCEMDPTPHLLSRRTTPLVALGVLGCAVLAPGLSFVVQPGPTDEERTRQFTQALNQNIAKEFEKKGWVSNGKGGWTSDTNTIQTYRKLNAEMEKAGWTTVSNGHYILRTNSEVLQRLRQEHRQQ